MKVVVGVAAAASSGLVGIVGMASPASADGCQAVTTSKGALTAAVVDTAVPSGTTVDATGCDIGVYYNNLGSGDNLSDVTVENATRYGVFVDGVGGAVSVDVANSHITNIGDSPKDGVQYGVGIYYYGYNTPGAVTGAINGNTVDQYQKGGIVVNGGNATASITDNTVTGLGQVDFIAQNGIQVGFGATGTEISGNSVSGNWYTGAPGTDSVGILLYAASTATNRNLNSSDNTFSGNQIKEFRFADTQASPLV